MENLEFVSEIGIPIPAHQNKFMVKYSTGLLARETNYDLLTRQTLSATYDIKNKTLKIIIELPLSLYEIEEQLHRFCINDSCSTIKIQYLDGSGKSERDTLCAIEYVQECKIELDYAINRSTAKAELLCKVRKFTFS
jgi:hypothetical protein